MEKVIDGIGTVKFRNSTRAKRVNITVKPFEDVVVSVPEHVSQEQAEQAVRDNLGWVQREQARMQEVEQKYTVFEIGDTYRIRDKKIRIQRGEYRCTASAVFVPDTGERSQQFIREQIEQLARAEAREFLPERARKLADQHDIPVGKITVRKSTTRWGSCSPENNLSLSYFLILLPDHLIDYAILHELAHVRIKDHSKGYWRHLESMAPEARKLDREIRGWPIGVV